MDSNLTVITAMPTAPTAHATEPQIPTHEIFHDNKPLCVYGAGWRAAMNLAADLMRKNIEWKHVEVRDIHGNKCGGVWRNPCEGRLIRSKEMG